MSKQNKTPRIRAVKKTSFGPLAQKTNEWFEVQYFSDTSNCWRSYRQYGNTATFTDKSKALDFCLRKKAGALSNQTFTEVIA